MDEEETLSFLDTPVTETTPATETKVDETKVETTNETTKVVEDENKGGEITIEETDETTPSSEVKDDPKMVPLSTFLDMRDRAKNAEAKLKGNEVANDDVEFVPPDPVKQPTEFAAYQQQIVKLNLMNERMNTSEEFAREKHGDELVDKVRDWALARADEDPEWFAKTVLDARNPYKAAIDAYNDHIEFEAFKAAKKAGKVEGEAPAAEQKVDTAKAATEAAKPAAVVKTQPAKKVVPKSIADVTSAGGAHTIPVGAGQAFDSMFKPGG